MQAMTKGELLNFIDELGVDYVKTASKSLIRNNHMNDIKDDEVIDQRIIDAIIVDFINFIGTLQGLDYAMYTKDLRK